MSRRDIVNQIIIPAINGDEKTVRSLLFTSKVNENIKHLYVNIALSLAAIYNRDSMVSFLIDNGADINMKINYDGSTALMDAARNNYESIVSFLIDKGADINMKNKFNG